MSDFSRFKEIRAYYKRVLPEALFEYRHSGIDTLDPYGLDFMKWETPIEDYTWQAIRRYGVPMYPQMPALNYFLDFANPYKKIVIECDGKQWHDEEKDAIRDAKLIADGWTIYRIPGRECMKVIDEPWEALRKIRDTGREPTEQEFSDICAEWFDDTCDGVVMAIGLYHFDKKNIGEEYYGHASGTLSLHRSEP